MDVIGNAAPAPAPGSPADPRGFQRPARRSGWRRAGAVVAALGLVGYVVTHRYPAPAPGGPAASPAVPPAPDPVALTGRAGSGPAGLRVVVNGVRPLIVDLHTGSVQRVTGPPGEASRRPFLYAVPIRGGLILYDEPADGTATSYLQRPGRRLERVVTDGWAIPGEDGRSLITFVYRRGSRGPIVGGRTLDGRTLWHWQASELLTLQRDTPYGLVVQRSDPQAPAVRLVRRETGQVLRTFSGPAVAVGERWLAQVRPGCGSNCRLVLRRLDTGTTRQFPLPAEPAPAYARFSPDERYLALTFPAGPEPGAPSQRAGWVSVLDLRTGALLPVDGLTTPGSRRPILDWSADSRWLVVGAQDGDLLRLGVWAPDRQREPITVIPPVRTDRAEAVISVLP